MNYKIYTVNNQLFIENLDSNTSFDAPISKAFFQRINGLAGRYYCNNGISFSDTLEIGSIYDVNDVLFTANTFEDFYTNLAITVNILTNFSDPLTDAELRATPINVTVTNQIDLTTVTSHLASIKQSCINIDANTDAVESKIDSVVTAINANGTVNHSDLLSVITQLQAVNANTDTLETVANSILAKIIASPSTLAEQQAQTTKLTAIDSKLGASLPLPTGASTSANQNTGNASLSSIDTKLSSQATASNQATIITNQTNGNQLVQALYIEEDTYTPVDGGVEVSRTLPRLDPSFNVKTRGSVLTDEGSFRDDFSSALGVDYVFTATGNGSTNQSTTFQNVLIGTNIGSTSLSILLDYSPIIIRGRLSISQRIANQTIQFGLRDNINTPNIASEFQLTGTANTSINVFSQSSASTGNSETYTHTIPNAKTTATALDYEIQVSVDEVSFFIDDVLIRTCKLHVPTTGTGSELYFFIKGTNTATVTQTTVSIDYLNVANMNTVEVKNDFNSKPLSVQQYGDQHHITGQLTTTATTADQNIISFVVPSNKTCFIIGYSIETANIGATSVKIGRGTLTAPTAGGEVDSQIFAQFKMADTSNTIDSFRNVDSGSFPRRLGSSGDTIRVAVQPRTNASTLWTATLYYILR